MHESVFLWSARAILLKYRRPMSARQLYDAALEEGFIPDSFNGETPWQTMKSKLSVHIRNLGDESVFVRTNPGRFYLRELIEEAEIYQAPPWQPPSSQEYVSVFPAHLLSPVSSMWFQGISTDLTALPIVSDVTCVSHLARPRAELTEDFKQFITYVLVTRRGEVLSFVRGVFNHTAEMLRGSRCIGFGGHVNAEDIDLFSTSENFILRSAARELQEELRLPEQDIQRLHALDGLEVVAILNDDSSSVGRRHFAVVIRYEVSGDGRWDTPQKGELSINQLKWVGPDREPIALEDYEYWSQLCLRSFYPELVRATPSVKIRRPGALTPPHVLCLVGEIGSGKTTATEILVREHGYQEVNTGRLVAELIGLPPVPSTPREVFQASALAFIRSADGPARLANAIAGQVRSTESNRVLVDGIRQLDTLKHLRQSLRALDPPREIGVVYVKTTPDVAYEFYRARERSGATLGDFLEVRDSEVEREIPLIFAESDAVLFNWLGRAELEVAIADMVKPS